MMTRSSFLSNKRVILQSNPLRTVYPYLQILFNYSKFFIRYNSPYLIKRVLQNIIKVFLKIVLLLLIQTLFSVNMFCVPVYYPPTVRDNLNYLNSKTILNKTQVKALYYTINKNHLSLESFEDDLKESFSQIGVNHKDSELMLQTLREVYNEYSINTNRLSNCFWDINLTDTLTRNTTGVNEIPPSLAHFLGVQQEYTDSFLGQRDSVKPFRRNFLGLSLGLLLSLEHLLVSITGSNEKKTKKLILYCFLGVLTLLTYLIVNVSDNIFTFFIPVVSSYDWSNFFNLNLDDATIVTFSNSSTIFYNGFSLILFCFLVYFLMDLVYYFVPLVCKILMMTGALTFSRKRLGHLTPYDSITLKIKMKYYEILKNAFCGPSWYLSVLKKELKKQDDPAFKEVFVTRELVYKITPVYSAKQGVTLAMIIMVLVNSILSISDMVESMYLNINDVEEFLSYLDDTYLDPQNYLMLGYNKEAVLLSFILALNIAKRLIITAPTMLLYYMLSPTVYYYTYFVPYFSFSVPFLYLLWTRNKRIDPYTITKKQKQKTAMKIVLTIVSFLLFCYPVLIDLPCFFAPMELNFYLFDKLIKKQAYKPYLTAGVVDFIAYNLNDAAFTNIAPVRDLPSRIYSRL